MNLIGDLERLFATSLYPLRVPIAIAVMAAIAGLLVLARRRGWFAAARRHPRRTGSVFALALVVGLPLTWYLASPLFIRTTLIEPPTAAAADSSPSEPGASNGATQSTGSADSTEEPESSDAGSRQPVPTAATAGAAATAGTAATGGAGSPPTEPAATQPTPTPTDAPATPGPTPSPTAFEPVVAASGTFRGADDFHFGQGTASIIETVPGRFTLRFEAFSVRNGPDLYVYLSPSAEGYADGVLELGTLKATDGSFGYELPAGIDPADFASAVIWCKQFAVLFAVAPFEAR